MRQYDACFHPVSDGQAVYFGSSSQNAVFALDAQTGKTLWNYVVEGPVRIAPTIHENRVLFGSDDGFVYCLDKKTGQLAWKFSPSQHKSAEQRRVLNNDRLISFYPVRTGVVVRDGTAYFAASLLPWRESYLCGVDLKTGQPNNSPNTFVVRHENVTLEGPMLVAEDRLIVPQGRIAPLLFDRASGKQQGSLPGGGGVTIVLTEKGDIARAEGGGAARAGQVGVFRGKERVASFPRGRSIVVRDDAFYVIDKDKVFAASRKANELIWKQDQVEPLEVIMIGSYLVVGCRDSLIVLDSKTGEMAWQKDVEGRVFGLAFARGALFAATDTGMLYAFRSAGTSKWKPPAKAVPVMRPQIPVPQISSDSPRPLHRWVFHRDVMLDASNRKPQADDLTQIRVKDLAGKVDLPLQGKAQSLALGKNNSIEAIELAGGMFPLSEKQAAQLPGKNLTLESWVRVDNRRPGVESSDVSKTMDPPNMVGCSATMATVFPWRWLARKAV